MEPTPGTVTILNTEVGVLVAVVVSLVLLLVIAGLMTWALIRAGSMRPPAALVTALSMLTLVSIIGGIATTNDEAWAIAAAGVGALAGSVTNVYQSSLERLERLINAQEEANKNGGPPPANPVPEQQPAEAPVVEESPADPSWDEDR